MPALFNDETGVRFSLPAEIDKRTNGEGNDVQAPPRSMSETCVRDGSTTPVVDGRLVGGGSTTWRKKTELGWFMDEIRRLARAEDWRREVGSSGGGCSHDADERRCEKSIAVTFRAEDVSGGIHDIR